MGEHWGMPEENGAADGMAPPQVRRAELMATIGSALTSLAPPFDQLQACTDALVRYLDAAFARIWVLDEAAGVLILRASGGLYTHLDGEHGRVPLGSLKIGRIAAERQPHLTNQVADDPHIGDRAWAAREKMVAFAGYPLVVADRLVGVLALFVRHPLADGTLDLLAAAADEIALGIARAQADEERTLLLERERTAREEVETINHLSALVVAELDLGTLVQAVTDAATNLTSAQFGAFFYNVLSERGEAYALYALSGVPREAFSQFPTPRNTALFGATFSGEGIVRLADVRADPRFGHNEPHYGMPPGHLPVVSYLAVPVMNRVGAVLGGLFFGHSDVDVFTARHERIVAGLATHAAIALENARLYRETQRALTLRDEFLGAVAHDLKTLLAVIKSTAQLLLRQAQRADGIAPDRLVSGLGRLDMAATRMARLVDHLLDVAHAHAGRMPEVERSPTDLVVLARRVAEEQQTGARRHHLRVEANPASLMGEWDASRLERVVDNLLSNAIKYSPEGGNVLIKIGKDIIDGRSEATLVVRDEGIGIAAADLPHVFERFRRGVNAREQISGMGIGLSNVAQIVDMHGGTITVDSVEHAGTTFTVRLPLAAPAPPSGTTESHLPS